MAARAAARKSTPRKAAPRKAATKRAAPRTGDGTTVEAPVNGVVPSPSETPKANAAIDLVADQGLDDAWIPADVERYYYLPQNGGPAIVFPAFTTLRPGRKFIWYIYKKSALVQGFEWMNLAKVPERIQERVIDLPDDEYGLFWKGWFSPIAPQALANPEGPPGES